MPKLLMPTKRPVLTEIFIPDWRMPASTAMRADTARGKTLPGSFVLLVEPPVQGDGDEADLEGLQPCFSQAFMAMSSSLPVAMMMAAGLPPGASARIATAGR